MGSIKIFSITRVNSDPVKFELKVNGILLIYIH